MNEDANWEAVAWFIAAEGSMQLNKKPKGLSPCVAAFNTEPEILEALLDMIDIGWVCEHRPANERSKLSYKWYVCNCDDVKKVLEKILPYMPSPRKAEVGKLLLEFCITHSNGSYSPHEWEIYQQIKKLNKKGKV